MINDATGSGRQQRPVVTTACDGDAPLLMSVSGVRGIVDKSMTSDVVAGLASAFAATLSAEQPSLMNGAQRPVIVLGRDSRPSGSEFSRAAADALTAAGFDVAELGIVATPTVAVMMKNLGAVGGIMITASHNSGEWNGMKMLTAAGSALSPDMARAVYDRFNEDNSVPASAQPGSIIADDRSNAVHVERVLETIDPEPIKAAGYRVVLDSINGGGSRSGRMLLDALACDVVHLNSEPDGNFAHMPEPVADNLTDLAATTARESAACGFAQDPDADRLAIVDETGTYIGEEYTLALAARQVLETRGPGAVVANLSTSRLIDDVAANHPGSTVIRTAVGEAHVAAAIREHGALIGGEGNGGVINPQVCMVRDSLSAMALVLSLLARRGQPLSELVNELPRYTMVKQKIDLKAIGGFVAVERTLANVGRAFADQRINTADGVRIDFDNGWAHLRPSNTEPIMRLIVEANSDLEAQQLAAAIIDAAGLE